MRTGSIADIYRDGAKNFVLATESLRLRSFCPSDWRDVLEYSADTEVTRYMPAGPADERAARAYIERVGRFPDQAPRLRYEWAITLRATNALIGGCDLRVENAQFQTALFGIVLNRRYWGRGYGTQAANALLCFGFEKIGLQKIEAECSPENMASRRVLEKAGMQFERLCSVHTAAQDERCGDCLYTISAADFQAAAPACKWDRHSTAELPGNQWQAACQII